ncbi:MAG: magnesium transporter [Armatimonadetes bacterium]|nr:magnesium transporter [Armatimonadota bacterium]MDE2206254.1 magnesium transporter [Armatimonadota bacterium]
MKYLTQLLNKRVIQPDGQLVGRVSDVVAELKGRLPRVCAMAVKTDGGELLLPYSALRIETDGSHPAGTGDIRGDIGVETTLAEAARYVASEEDMFLRRDVLDKQIVDVQDRRVVRVSDVRLAPFGDGYCVIGVDASLRATLRRLGALGAPIELIARKLRRPLRANLIGWDDVQTLDPGSEGGRIRLRVSHDKIAKLHPADIADIVEQLSPQQGADVIKSLDMETAADAIAEAEPEVQVQIMQHLDQERRADIIEEMEPDEAADLLDGLPDFQMTEILDQMEPDDAKDLQELMAYDEDTAGGLMTTELVSIREELTCEETIDKLRKLAPRAETIYYVYVVDEEDRLVGVLSLRDLVISPPSTPVRQIMVRNVLHVYLEDHANQVAQVIGRYNLLAVPVVSDDEKLVGIITVDDTMERLLPPERRRKLPTPALTDGV